MLVPHLSVLLGGEDDAESDVEPTGEQVTERSEGRDVLETLCARYARGELTDEQFKRKLERLLETETIEDVEDARRRADGERTGRPDDACSMDATGGSGSAEWPGGGSIAAASDSSA